MQYDNVIIGAGVSGMTTAILLARQGRKTALVEAARQIAPTIRGFRRKNIYFDTGFHYASLLDNGGALATLLDYLGLMPYLTRVPLQPNTHDKFYCVRSGADVTLPRNLEGLKGLLKEMYSAEEAAINEYLDEIGVFLKALNSNIFGTVENCVHFSKHNGSTLSDYLTKNFSDPVLKTLLSVHGLLYGSLPEETALGFHAMVAGGYYSTGRQLVDGGKALTEAYEETLSRNGVELYTDRKVEKIDLDSSGKVREVMFAEGGGVECNNCIYSANLRELTGLLPEGSFRPVYRQRLRDLQESGSALIIYCVETDSNDTSDTFSNLMMVHNTFPDMGRLNADVSERPVFISRSYPEKGKGGLSIICPCPFEAVSRWEDSRPGQRHPDYRQWKLENAGKIVAAVEKHVHSLSGRLRIIDVGSPLTFRDYMNAPDGCLYGVKHRFDEMPFLPRTKIKGLYLTGQAVVSPGIMGAVLAGFLCARAMTGKDYGKELQ